MVQIKALLNIVAIVRIGVNSYRDSGRNSMASSAERSSMKFSQVFSILHCQLVFDRKSALKAHLKFTLMQLI